MPQKLRPGAENLYGFPQPTQSNLQAPVIAKRDPGTADTGYSLGQSWVNKSSGTQWFLVGVAAGSATWSSVSAGSGSVNSINSLSPSGGNIVIAGYESVTANDVTPMIMRSYGQSGTTEIKASAAAVGSPGMLDTTFNKNTFFRNIIFKPA